MEIVEFLKINSSWIKDLFTIIFAGTATILAILTYRRAKATILQPKRIEVTKKQTEILSNFLTIISDNHNSIDNALDYIGLFSYNVDLILREYGLIEIDRSSEGYKEMNSNIAGWLQFLENDIHDFVFIKGNLASYEDLFFYTDDRKRQKFYSHQLIQGNVKTHRIFYTKKHVEFYEALRDLKNNPFIPKEIQDCALEIGVNLKANIHNDLRAILAKLAKEYYRASIDKEGSRKIILLPEYRHQELYRIFESERKQHGVDYILLKNKIRNHLLVDDKW